MKFECQFFFAAFSLIGLGMTFSRNGQTGRVMMKYRNRRRSPPNVEVVIAMQLYTLWREKNGISGMLRRVALVRTDVSEDLRAPFIRVTRIGELGTTLAVTSKRRNRRFGGA
jgi:hypothetical protein